MLNYTAEGKASWTVPNGRLKHDCGSEDDKHRECQRLRDVRIHARGMYYSEVIKECVILSVHMSVSEASEKPCPYQSCHVRALQDVTGCREASSLLHQERQNYFLL